MTSSPGGDELEPAELDVDETAWAAGGPWNETATYWHTRAAFLRGLGFIYAVAFFSLFRQMDGLLASRGRRMWP